jgi:hypothetical protein
MTAASTYLANAQLGLLFRGGAFAAPATWAALHVGDPTAAALVATEVTGGGYQRVQVAPAGWTAPSSGTLSNAAQIQFANPTASWGAVSHVSIWDAATGGNMLLSGPLAQAKSVTAGDTVRFAVGDLAAAIS